MICLQKNVVRLKPTSIADMTSHPYLPPHFPPPKKSKKTRFITSCPNQNSPQDAQKLVISGVTRQLFSFTPKISGVLKRLLITTWVFWGLTLAHLNRQHP